MTPLNDSRVAYFSMEIALNPAMPTYSGGLGILAGDTLRSAADLGVRMVAVTLLHRKGYFRQRVDEQGNQFEEPAPWRPETFLELMKPVTTVSIAGREVRVRAWRYLVEGVTGHIVPVYLLDASLPENSPWDQTLTDNLYGGDHYYRLCQEAILGIGGVQMLTKLGHHHIGSYHMNEGHSALLGVALLEQRLGSRTLRTASEDDIHAARHRIVFTTHTPVPAGHDQFPLRMVQEVLGEDRAAAVEKTGACPDGSLNMTLLALFSSRYINGVAMRHGEVSRSMFPQYPIRAITNGVHAGTWTTAPFRALYDRHIPEWKYDNLYLRYALGIPLEEIRGAHMEAKKLLVAEVQRRTGQALDPTVMTVGFARRAATYKRGDLIFRDRDRLRWIARTVGGLQIVFGGKAHPRDDGGKELIRRITEHARGLHDYIRVVYVEDFDWQWAPVLYSGVDLWLNTPKRPQEASGTSGMKAALNGVPSLSILDGWWIEGCLEGVTGWCFADRAELAEDEAYEAGSLYHKLERVIMPMFYSKPDAYARVMRSTIAANGSFFNTHRMVSQYLDNAWFRDEEREQPGQKIA
ncbi:MAG: alpha-glucan family phosphorylase [Bryobacteraceae bacterium]|nr:alpha-glucan family phosphorylase [Bryobacteraceae bacterium]